MDIHYIGVQMRGGPEFSVGDEFVLGARRVFCNDAVASAKRCVVRRLLQWSIEANGSVAAVLAADIRCNVIKFGDRCRIVTSDTRQPRCTSFHHSFHLRHGITNLI